MNADDSLVVSDVAATTYEPEQDRSVSGAVLDAIASYRGEDLTQSDCTLYDDIDPDVLDDLFREGSRPNTVVEFDTRDVRVMLWDEGTVEIRVTGLPNMHDRAE